MAGLAFCALVPWKDRHGPRLLERAFAEFEIFRLYALRCIGIFHSSARLILVRMTDVSTHFQEEEIEQSRTD
jgi:hypothetical protein